MTVSPPSTTSSAPTTESAALFARAHAVTPGGVNSPVRAFNAVGGTPRFIDRAAGPVAHRRRRHRVRRPGRQLGPDAARPRPPRGAGGGARRRSRAARRTAPRPGPRSSWPRRSSPAPRVEKVRLVSSGTEATMSAIRLARGFTGRDLVVKFAGCYHGHVDSLLAQAGSGLATLAVPGTPGVPAAADRRHHRAALQRPGRGAGGVRRARRRHRLPHHRGRARQHGGGPARARVQRHAGRDLRRARRAVRQRRGDDRLPGHPLGPLRAGRRRRGLEARPDAPSARSWAAASRPRRSAAGPT